METREQMIHAARAAKQNRNWDEMQEAYRHIMEAYPMTVDCEVMFYTSFGFAKNALEQPLFPIRSSMFEVLITTIDGLDTFFDMNREEEMREIICTISDDIMAMESEPFVYVGEEQKKQTIDMLCDVTIHFRDALKKIAMKYPEAQKAKRRLFYELIIKQGNQVIDLGYVRIPRGLQLVLLDYHKLIHEIDPAYVVPTLPPEQKTATSSGGCYVATAVYGSYDCPEVWTLRRYRDETLARTWYGRAFIRTYYAVSPTLVKWFSNTAWFKKLWKGKLDRMIENLQQHGVESTPYEDKRW